MSGVGFGEGVHLPNGEGSEEKYLVCDCKIGVLWGILMC